MSKLSLQAALNEAFATAVAHVTGTPVAADAQVRPAGDPQFGDYQCNIAMSLARQLQRKPRDVAQQIVDAVAPALADVAEPLEIAGPGFINIRLKAEYLARRLGQVPAERSSAPERDRASPAPDAVASARGVPAFEPRAPGFDRLGIPPVETPQRVVVEYSQPNIAKQMHVGHLRSTIIGDVFARVLAFEGHEVIRQNHIGDWGTQFGLLIRWYREHPLPTPATHADVLEAIEEDYRAANARDKADPQFAKEARQAVAELQGGDPAARRVWEQICQVSWQAFTTLYERLGVLLRPEDVRGESFYNARLAPLVAELRQKGAGSEGPGPGVGIQGSGADAKQRLRGSAGPTPAGVGSGERTARAPWHAGTGHVPRMEVREDAGAVCVFLYDDAGEPLFRGPEGDILPLIIQKRDGAFLYATTDLAAIRYRLQELPFAGGVGAQRVIYVTDARQKLHFQMFFAAARAAGWITPAHEIDHVTFGSVLGPDRKPLKTREGVTIKLKDLLDEAEARALALLQERHACPEARGRAGEQSPSGSAASDLDASWGADPAIARTLGVAAVKYADLRNDRNTDYVFTWEKMLSFDGNTAPYMLYAYARVRSIYRKAASACDVADVYGTPLALHAPPERELALKLMQFRETVESVARDLMPHVLCSYLYDLAGAFMRFYENCPVLSAAEELRRSRLRLCDLTARTLKLGLGLLGIEVVERM